MSPYTARKTSVKICEYLVVLKAIAIDQLHSKKPKGYNPKTTLILNIKS